MSASGVRERMATAEGSMRVCREYAGLEVNIHQAPVLAHRPNGCAGWMDASETTSAGCVVWIKERLRERGLLGVGLAVDDGYMPALVEDRYGRMRVPMVARSKIFRTNLRVIEPIDLTTGMVAGLGFLFRRKGE